MLKAEAENQAYPEVTWAIWSKPEAIASQNEAETDWSLPKLV